MPVIAKSILTTVEQAAQLIYQFMPPSPHISWPLLNQRVGATVWVKHENHNPTGSFKLRGGLWYVHCLRQCKAVKTAHLVTSTRGNHGQSIAYAGQQFGFDVSIVVPHGNSPCKNAAMQAYGATLIPYGEDIVAAARYAEMLADEQDAVFVPSFHTDLVDGVATYSLELLTALPKLDVVYVPIGMGSGLCGMVQVRDALNLKTRIVGVVAEQADAYAQSVEAGHLMTTQSAHTIADGIACRVPKPDALNRMQPGVTRGQDCVVRVSEAAIQHAMAVYFMDTHNVAEGASAAALAAVLQDAARLQGKQVGVVHTGGNIDTTVLLNALSHNNQH
jgi:threonine dehydratase